MKATWAGILLLTVGCSADRSGPSGPTTTADGLVLRVAASPAAIVPGQSLTVAVTLMNPTTSEVTLHFSDSCQLLYAIEDTSGATVSPSFACLTMLTTLSLPAGSTKEVTSVWDGRRELPSGGSAPVPAGSYRVYGVLGHGPTRSQAVTIMVRAGDR